MNLFFRILPHRVGPKKGEGGVFVVGLFFPSSFQIQHCTNEFKAVFFIKIAEQRQSWKNTNERSRWEEESCEIAKLR